MSDSKRDDAIGGPDREGGRAQAATVIPGDELDSILRSLGFDPHGITRKLARRVERETLHRVAEPAPLRKPELVPLVRLRELAAERGLEWSTVLESFARCTEYEVHTRNQQLGRVTSNVVLPLAEHEAAFINSVRTVVAGIRESVMQEERERLARVLPEWLKKGGAA